MKPDTKLLPLRNEELRSVPDVANGFVKRFCFNGEAG